MPSKRVQTIDTSGIRRAFALAAKLENPCNLSIGRPHFDTPEPIKQAGIRAIEEGRTKYTATQGIPELTQALANQYVKDGAPQDSVLVTCAVSGGFFLALMATCDPGDELIVPDPFFLSWPSLSMVTGVKASYVDTYPDFRWTREKLEAAITPRSRAIIITSPANPTGVITTEEEMKMIAEVAAKHDLWIIHDEIYKAFTYGQKHCNMSNYYRKTITLSGFSKSHAMTGWRVGCAAGPKEIIDEMMKLQQYTHICTSTAAQWAAIEALDYDTQEMSDQYRKNRDYVLNELSEYYEFTEPGGGLFLFPKLPDDVGGDEFVERAIAHELLVIAGNVFSCKDTHFRLSFGVSESELERGVHILKELAEELCLV